ILDCLTFCLGFFVRIWLFFDLGKQTCIFQHLADRCSFFYSHMQLQCDFLQRGISSEFFQQTFVHSSVILQSCPHFLTDSVGTGLQRHCLCHIQANPAVPLICVVSTAIIADCLPQA